MSSVFPVLLEGGSGPLDPRWWFGHVAQPVLLLWMSCVDALTWEGSNCLDWRAGMAMAVL